MRQYQAHKEEWLAKHHRPEDFVPWLLAAYRPYKNAIQSIAGDAAVHPQAHSKAAHR